MCLCLTSVVWQCFDNVSMLVFPLTVMTSGGVLSMMNNYPGTAQSYGPPTSPANSRGFPPASSPGALDMYSGQDSIGYVQAASPQPAGFPSIAVSDRSK